MGRCDKGQLREAASKAGTERNLIEENSTVCSVVQVLSAFLSHVPSLSGVQQLVTEQHIQAI